MPANKITRLKKFQGTILSILLFASGQTLNAQNIQELSHYNLKQYFTQQPQGWVTRAIEMLDNNNYQGVIDQLSHLQTADIGEIANTPITQQEMELCSYMLAMAYYNINNAECKNLLQTFITNNPASPLAKEARLTLGDYYFFNHKFSDALQTYNLINITGLSKENRDLYTYRKALSMIKCGLASEAQPLMQELKTNPQYATTALYYDAYCDYANGLFNSAYDKFRKVVTLESGVSSSRQPRRASNRNNGMPKKEASAYTSQGIEPYYYIVQIDYLRNNFNEVINTGTRLLQRRPVEELLPEINRIVGLSYFKLGNESEARKYLTDYLLATDTINASSDALYAMGVIEFNNGNIDQARSLLSLVTDDRNAIAQSAFLYLGQCAAADNDFASAAIAFDNAAGMNFDKNVSEKARYNLIVASANGVSTPFTSQTDMLEAFISDYPYSPHIPEVRTLLAQAYFNDRNFRKALENIERIESPTQQINLAKQKILLELGAELLSNSQPAEAVKYLKRAAEGTQPDAQLAANAYLWLGDALYAQNSFKQASQAYKKATQMLKKGDNHTLALYNLAYSAFMADDFATAAGLFADALSATPALPSSLKEDAIVRRADCLNYTGHPAEAEKLYSQAIAANANTGDYAAFRRATLPGTTGDNKTKIMRLEEFVAAYPNSKWIPDAKLELASALIATGNPQKGAETLLSVINTNSSQPQARTATLNLAYLYTELKQFDKAADAYREIIYRWPTAQEAQIAHNDLQRYYAGIDKLDEYDSFLKSIPGAPSLSKDSREQLTFDAAANALADNPSDIKLMEAYVERYPNGSYLATALLSLGRNYIDNGETDQGLNYLDKLIKLRTDAPEAVEGLILSARTIEEFYPDRKEMALARWKQLEKQANPELLPLANSGIMRTTSNSKERITYAEKVLSSGGVAAEDMDEALFHKATGLLESGNSSEAINILSRLSENPQTLAGSRAAVALAQYYIDKKNYAAATKILNNFTESGSPHHYWVARGFIALSDALKAQGKVSLARDYLNSVRRNYPGKNDDIISLIDSRLK